MNYDTLLVWSMNFLIDGPKVETPDGILPGYLVTSAYEASGMEFPEFLKAYPEVLSGGKPLPSSCWTFGSFRGCDNILTINRSGVTDIEIVKR